MSKFRKIISLILSLLMIISIMPITDIAVFASETDDILDYITYEIVDGEVTITDCADSISGDIVIPDTIEGYPVTTIGGGAFYYCESLESVTIGNSVTTIGDSAFEDCSSLGSITIPDSVTTIGYEAFEYCDSLERVTILNPDCLIYDSSFTIYSDAMIYGYPGSTAEEYAEKYDRAFVVIDDSVCTHNYIGVITAPTYTTQGYTTYTCSLCGDSYVSDYTSIEEHSLQHVTVASTCTTEGVEYDICYTCHEMFNYTVLPLAEHSYGDWVVTKVATFINCGEETRTCTVCSATETRETEKLVATNEFVNEDTGVSVSVTDDTYEGDIVVEVTQVFDGTSFQIINAQIGNFAASVFDISTTVNGEKVQPNGTVLIKMPIPEGYSTDALVIYYLPNDGSAPEKMDSYIEGNYICFETTHFSEYAIVDESEEVPAYEQGDVNFDGHITAADARLALRISAQLENATEIQLLAADVSGEGKVTAADARKILRVAANLESF